MLIMVDDHCSWLKAIVVNSATSQTTIEKLRSVFATNRLPEVLVSDIGSIFISAEFDKFVRRNGIKHLTSAPYHPGSNGLAERAVQIIKAALNKAIYYWNIPGDSNLAILISISAKTPHYYRSLPSRTE